MKQRRFWRGDAVLDSREVQVADERDGAVAALHVLLLEIGLLGNIVLGQRVQRVLLKVVCAQLPRAVGLVSTRKPVLLLAS